MYTARTAQLDRGEFPEARLRKIYTGRQGRNKVSTISGLIMQFWVVLCLFIMHFLYNIIDQNRCQVFATAVAGKRMRFKVDLYYNIQYHGVRFCLCLNTLIVNVRFYLNDYCFVSLLLSNHWNCSVWLLTCCKQCFITINA